MSLIGVALLLLGMRGIGGGPVTHRFFNPRGLSRDGFGEPEMMLKVVGRAVLYIRDWLAGGHGQLCCRGSLYMNDGLLVGRPNRLVFEIVTRLGAAEGL